MLYAYTNYVKIVGECLAGQGDQQNADNLTLHVSSVTVVTSRNTCHASPKMSFNHIVDRIAVLSSAIHEKASHSTHAKSRYAGAMLHQPLAAYVREAEVVESRMFVVPQPGPGEIPSAVDLARKETASATPLKKARDAPLALLEPEEYIRSVLRLGEK